MGLVFQLQASVHRHPVSPRGQNCLVLGTIIVLSETIIYLLCRKHVSFLFHVSSGRRVDTRKYFFKVFFILFSVVCCSYF